MTIDCEIKKNSCLPTSPSRNFLIKEELTVNDYDPLESNNSKSIAEDNIEDLEIKNENLESITANSVGKNIFPCQKKFCVSVTVPLSIMTYLIVYTK